MSNDYSRRNFIKLTGLGIAASSIKIFSNPLSEEYLGKNENASEKLKLSITSYNFRDFKLEQVIQMTKRLDLSRISLKDMHLPLNSTKEEIEKAVSEIKDAGLELYGAGVIYMTNKDEVNNAFDYANAAGIRVMIGVPEHDLLPIVEEKVKGYNIKLAIHNHGPNDKRFPSPGSIYEKIKNMDKRMGICLDIGHAMRLGIDPSDAFEKYHDRIFEIHLKDVSKAAENGNTIEIGRGVIDIPKFLKTLLKYDYSNTVAFEFEKDEKDPLPGIAESVGYVKGVLTLV